MLRKAQFLTMQQNQYHKGHDEVLSYCDDTEPPFPQDPKPHHYHLRSLSTLASANCFRSRNRTTNHSDIMDIRLHKIRHTATSVFHMGGPAPRTSSRNYLWHLYNEGSSPLRIKSLNVNIDYHRMKH